MIAIKTLKALLGSALLCISVTASASTVNLASGGVYSTFDNLPPGLVEINVGAGVTGAKFQLEDTINDGYTVNYQLYESDQTTTVGGSWSFTDIGLTSQNLAQGAVYRALTTGAQYFLKLTFADGDASSYAASTRISAVPLPGAALLFGSALLGMGALRRKLKAGDNSEMAAV